MVVSILRNLRNKKSSSSFDDFQFRFQFHIYFPPHAEKAARRYFGCWPARWPRAYSSDLIRSAHSLDDRFPPHAENVFPGPRTSRVKSSELRFPPQALNGDLLFKVWLISSCNISAFCIEVKNSFKTGHIGQKICYSKKANLGNFELTHLRPKILIVFRILELGF